MSSELIEVQNILEKSNQQWLWECVEHIEQMQQDGASELEINQWLDKHFEDDGDRRSWYRCVRCRDVGFVNVWSVVAMRAWKRGEIDNSRWQRTAVVPCDCDKGQKYVDIKRDKKDPAWTRCYDPKQDCLVSNPHSKLEIEAFCEWCEQRNNESHEWSPDEHDYPGEF